MRPTDLSRIAAGVVCLGLLTSCATSLKQGALSACAIRMNEDAGKAGLVLIPLHLKDGEELSFVLDTGAPVTILDDSLEHKLGAPARTENIVSMFGREAADTYRAPAIYLGDTRLRTGGRVLTWDMKRVSGRLGRFNGSNHRLMGILGMDCLRHYCIQLDFGTQTVRFIDQAQVSQEDLGKACRLAWDRQGCPAVEGREINADGILEVDTGCIDRSKTNVLGLPFLADYVVTFDFPRKIMYLRPARPQPEGTNSGPAHNRLSAARVRVGEGA